MIDEIKKELASEMDKSISSLGERLLKVRTGRASSNLVDEIPVDYYGTPTPIKQVGQVSTPEARLLQIQPFDKTMIPTIEKALLKANLGVTPVNDGNLIRLSFPALTEEKRKEQVKEIKKLGEDAKIAIRNLRREQNEVVKKAEKAKEISEDDSKKYQSEIQTVTDEHIKKIDQIIKVKEEELLTI